MHRFYSDREFLIQVNALVRDGRTYEEAVEIVEVWENDSANEYDRFQKMFFNPVDYAE